MKILYLNCGMGAAGDMLTAALLGLHPDPDGFLKRLNTALAGKAEINCYKIEKCGIRSNQVSVIIDGDCEGDAHEHHHAHTSIKEILALIDSMAVPEKVKDNTKNVFNLIARAESQVHGTDMENIHFHELGTIDAVADVLSVSMLIYELAPDRIYSSPVSVGSGFVKCAHGILPVPTPATELLLRGLPVQSGGIEGELCTPTGAALLKYFVDEFGDMPLMCVEMSGYGAGKKDFSKANLLRVMIGSAAE